VVDLRYTFGVPGTLGFISSAGARSDVGPAGVPSSSSATINFSNTLRLVSVEVLDENLQTVPGAQVVSANGFVYQTGPVASLCSGLGLTNPRKLDQDTFRFDGTGGEEIILQLDKDPAGAHTGDQARLAVVDAIRGVTLSLTDIGPLPRIIVTTLPGTGRYLVSVAELLPSILDRFRGAYCLSLQSSGEAQETLAPHTSVE
jgi:hypothetical protein